MYQQRRERIVALVDQHGHVRVADLVAELNVSEATIRRDLAYLADKKLIRRAWGGASTPDVSRLTPSWPAYAPNETSLEKFRIARTAAQLVTPGQWIFIENGGTTLALARALLKVPRLRVVTNSLHIAYLLHVHGRCSEVNLTGGTLRRDTYLWGPLTLSTLDQVRVDMCFIGAKSISIERGLTEPDLQGAQMKRALLSIGQQVVLIAGHEKIGTESPVLVSPLHTIDTLVTTSGITDDESAAIQALGVDVLVC